MKPRPVHTTKGSDPDSRGKPASKGRSRASSADTARKPDPVQTVPSGRERHWEGIVGPEGADRADRYIAEVLGILSRSQIKARGATILLGGKPIKLSRPLPAGGQLRVDWVEEDSVHLVAEDIPLNVLYEDGNVIVIDKPQGMVTHPGHGNHRGTLANALAGRYGIAGGDSAEAQGDPVRGFIVHRLDKDTSGVIIAARNTQAQEFLAGQFRDRLAKKQYLAIVSGVLDPREGRVENRLCRDKRERKRFCVSEGEGRLSVTEYRTLAVWNQSRAGETRIRSLVLLKPRTGRTHQLRVHMKYLGCPILGDPVYGRRDSGYPDISLMLHAWRLKIKVPDKNGAMIFMAPLPGRFRKMIAELGGLPPPRSRAGNQE